MDGSPHSEGPPRHVTPAPIATTAGPAAAAAGSPVEGTAAVPSVPAGLPAPEAPAAPVAAPATAAHSVLHPSLVSPVRGTGSDSSERCAKRQRVASSGSPVMAQSTAAGAIFGSDSMVGHLYLGAQTATVEWRIERFQQQRQRADGACLDGPKFGPREPWQIFCHPDGRCFNQPQGGPPGVFLRYLGPHERVPAYATIEKLVDGHFCVPENNARDAPFVVLFGRNEIEEWGVCKDFGLFDDSFGRNLLDEALVLRARVAWIEPRADSLLPREVVCVRQNAAGLNSSEGSLQADLGTLWNARSQFRTSGAASRSPAASGGPVLPSVSSAPRADIVLVCEQQRFEADRCILAARSQFFGAMLSNRQYRESGQREVELPDLSARALSACLRFVYTDEGPDMRSREDAEELLAAASKLGITGLLRLCSDHLRDYWLTVGSAISLLRLADEHGATSLRSEALAVLGASFDQVKTTPEFQELLREGMNPALIQDTLQAVADASIYAGRASIKL